MDKDERGRPGVGAVERPEPGPLAQDGLEDGGLFLEIGLPPREQGRASGKPVTAAPAKAPSATRRPAGSPKPGAPRRAR